MDQLKSDQKVKKSDQAGLVKNQELESKKVERIRDWVVILLYYSCEITERFLEQVSIGVIFAIAIAD